MKTDKQITMHFGGGCLYLKCHKCGKEVGHAEVKFPGTPEQQKEPRKKLAFGYSSIFYLHCLDMAPMLPCSMTELSKCCDAPVEASLEHGHIDVEGDWGGKEYICSVCKNPCDIQDTNE